MYLFLFSLYVRVSSLLSLQRLFEEGEDMSHDANVIETWNEQLLELCVPSNFKVTIMYEPSLLQKIAEAGYSQKELSGFLDRMIPKLEIIKSLAAKQSAAMLKGTLKYRSDVWSINDWIGYLLDDAGDGLNYAYLLAAQIERAVDPETRARRG